MDFPKKGLGCDLGPPMVCREGLNALPQRQGRSKDLAFFFFFFFFGGGGRLDLIIYATRSTQKKGFRNLV